MTCDFAVPYPSTKLVNLLIKIGEDIERRYVKERNELVTVAKNRLQTNVFSRLYHGDGWHDVVLLDKSYAYKSGRIAELALAASVSNTVSVSSEVFKWLNHHDNEEWAW